MKNVLVPVDFSDATETVVASATKLSKSLGAMLTLLHVAPPEPEFIGYQAGPQSVRDNVARHLHEEHQKLQDVRARIEATGLKVAALLVQGYPAEKILKEAERINADVVVMGSHGRGALYHLLVGSVTDGVLRKSKCPVLVVPVAKG